MIPMPGKLLATILVGAFLVLAGSAYADGDHDRARRAHLAGEVVGLDQLLAAVARDRPGKVIDVELERERGRMVYEVKLITPDGRLQKMKYDARSLERLAR